MSALRETPSFTNHWQKSSCPNEVSNRPVINVEASGNAGARINPMMSHLEEIGDEACSDNEGERRPI